MRTPAPLPLAALSRILLPLVLLLGCPSAADDDDGADDDAADDDAGDDDTGDDDTGDDDTAPPPIPELVIGCTDAEETVYITPVGLPPWGPVVLGQVVRCAEGEALSTADVVDRLSAAGVGDVAPYSGARTHLIAYRTTREEGQGGVSTARLYLPDTVIPDGPLPVVVVGHAAAGISDDCAPSRSPESLDALALPLAGRGFVVVAPDYAGLGNEGTQGYRDPVDVAHSLLDAIRAVRFAVTPESLADGAVIVGVDQGGGGALAAHALASSYGPEPLLGVVAAAPDWPADEGALSALLHDDGSLWFTGTQGALFTLQLWADGARFMGPLGATVYLEPALAEAVAVQVEGACIEELLGTLGPIAGSYQELMEDSFQQSAADCLDGLPACGQPGQGFVDRYRAGLLAVDAAGGPIALTQGMADDVIPPAATACVADKLLAEGVPPQRCTFDGVGHWDVVQAGAAFTVEWVEALVQGGAPPPCAASDLPPC